MSPGSTSSDGGEKVNLTSLSGSRPVRKTRRTRDPPRLSMIASSCPTAVSRTRTTLGSSRSTTGVSTGAADVVCTNVAPHLEIRRALRRRQDASAAWLDSCPGGGGGASILSLARPTSPAKTSMDGGEKAKCTMPSGSRPPRKTRLVRVPLPVVDGDLQLAGGAVLAPGPGSARPATPTAPRPRRSARRSRTPPPRPGRRRRRRSADGWPAGRVRALAPRSRTCGAGRSTRRHVQHARGEEEPHQTLGIAAGQRDRGAAGCRPSCRSSPAAGRPGCP